MTDQPLDARGVIRFLRRRRRSCVAAVIIGLLAGLGFAIIRPTQPTSTAEILLPNPPTTASGAPTDEVDTQVRIASSLAILGNAGRQLDPHRPASWVRRHVNISAPTSNVLSVTATAETGNQARALANAVTAAYVGYTNGLASATSNAGLQSLQRQYDVLTSQLKSLQTETATTLTRLGTESPSSPNGQRDTQLIDALRAQQGTASLARQTVVAQMTAAENSTPPGARVFQVATSAQRASQLAHTALAMAVGGIGALFLVLLQIGLAARFEQRLYDPRRISGALGAPLAGFIVAPSSDSVRSLRRLLTSPPRSADHAWQLHRTLSQIGRGAFVTGNGGRGQLGERRRVRLLTIQGDGPAVAGAAGLVGAFDRLGFHVVTKVTGAGRSCARLSTALSTLRKSGGGNHAKPFHLEVASVDAISPVLTSAERDVHTILVVTAGTLTASDLGRLALACADRSVALDDVVVVNPLDVEPATSQTQPDEPVQLTAVGQRTVHSERRMTTS